MRVLVACEFSGIVGSDKHFESDTLTRGVVDLLSAQDGKADITFREMFWM